MMRINGLFPDEVAIWGDIEKEKMTTGQVEVQVDGTSKDSISREKRRRPVTAEKASIDLKDFGTVENPKNLYIGKVEKDPSGADPHQKGAKLDAGKIPVFRGLIDYFPNACLAVAEVSQAGANKYTWKGWIDVPDGKVRYTDAMVRHLIKESTEGEIDPDFGLLHAAHLAWSALARLELILLEKKNV